MSFTQKVSPPIYHVSYWKKEGAKRSLSYLSQCMLTWMDLQKAIRGRVRGEYYILGDIRDEFKRVASTVEAEFKIEPLDEAETVKWRSQFYKQATTISPKVTRDKILEETTPLSSPIPHELHEKIAGINEAIQRIENQIQGGGTERESVPIPASRNHLNENEENRADWSEVVEGFQFYRDIFRTGLDNPKTQDGLYAALREVATRVGLEEKEVLEKMDVALEIARKHAGKRK
ncbi:MAG: hypothetical protein RBG13Loki_4029 [Promethearchaeota archaeon CR_4]|nr:MAG: hypothetical protein RBG13Loki_4029 [Candidatus Lokiarchaeota archaeon CR_4]